MDYFLLLLMAATTLICYTVYKGINRVVFGRNKESVFHGWKYSDVSI